MKVGEDEKFRYSQSQPVNGKQEKASSPNKDFQKAVLFSRECPRNKTSFYNCGKEGHNAVNCKAGRKSPKSERSSGNNMTDEGEIVKSKKRSRLIFKDVSFNGKSASVLIDTGSDLCIICYDTLNIPSVDVDLSSGERQLMGIGTIKLTTIGSFTTSIEIDNIKLEVKFHVADDTPVYEIPRRMSYTDRQEVDEQVKEWLKDGIINYASPVVLVSKTDGKKRLCCDHRRLNSKIVRDKFPKPNIDTVIEMLQGANVFTTLDLRN
ncbi:uncharacterized protein LOC128923499 [Zeugodacus cucurbitae]|uniref:uncharacterized protein LOC128923499 n=1 Tax=Zeugodacus cucurbitae TaxID=28588 RepID=UPI0023D96058|nr:uncharacterized protein LOC128923499 [Zeugodacus cucurbitae]